MPFTKHHRCFFYSRQGEPLRDGCKFKDSERGCFRIHPDEDGWKDALHQRCKHYQPDGQANDGGGCRNRHNGRCPCYHPDEPEWNQLGFSHRDRSFQPRRSFSNNQSTGSAWSGIHQGAGRSNERPATSNEDFASSLWGEISSNTGWESSNANTNDEPTKVTSGWDLGSWAPASDAAAQNNAKHTGGNGSWGEAAQELFARDEVTNIGWGEASKKPTSRHTENIWKKGPDVGSNNGRKISAGWGDAPAGPSDRVNVSTFKHESGSDNGWGSLAADLSSVSVGPSSQYNAMTDKHRRTEESFGGRQSGNHSSCSNVTTLQTAAQENGWGDLGAQTGHPASEASSASQIVKSSSFNTNWASAGWGDNSQENTSHSPIDTTHQTAAEANGWANASGGWGVEPDHGSSSKPTSHSKTGNTASDNGWGDFLGNESAATSDDWWGSGATNAMASVPTADWVYSSSDVPSTVSRSLNDTAHQIAAKTGGQANVSGDRKAGFDDDLLNKRTPPAGINTSDNGWGDFLGRGSEKISNNGWRSSAGSAKTSMGAVNWGYGWKSGSTDSSWGASDALATNDGSNEDVRTPSSTLNDSSRTEGAHSQTSSSRDASGSLKQVDSYQNLQSQRAPNSQWDAAAGQPKVTYNDWNGLHAKHTGDHNRESQQTSGEWGTSTSALDRSSAASQGARSTNVASTPQLDRSVTDGVSSGWDDHDQSNGWDSPLTSHMDESSHLQMSASRASSVVTTHSAQTYRVLDHKRSPPILAGSKRKQLHPSSSVKVATNRRPTNLTVVVPRAPVVKYQPEKDDQAWQQIVWSIYKAVVMQLQHSDSLQSQKRRRSLCQSKAFLEPNPDVHLVLRSLASDDPYQEPKFTILKMTESRVAYNNYVVRALRVRTRVEGGIIKFRRRYGLSGKMKESWAERCERGEEEFNRIAGAWRDIVSDDGVRQLVTDSIKDQVGTLSQEIDLFCQNRFGPSDVPIADGKVYLKQLEKLLEDLKGVYMEESVRYQEALKKVVMLEEELKEETCLIDAMRASVLGLSVHTQADVVIHDTVQKYSPDVTDLFQNTVTLSAEELGKNLTAELVEVMRPAHHVIETLSDWYTGKAEFI